MHGGSCKVVASGSVAESVCYYHVTKFSSLHSCGKEVCAFAFVCFVSLCGKYNHPPIWCKGVYCVLMV